MRKSETTPGKRPIDAVQWGTLQVFAWPRFRFTLFRLLVAITLAGGLLAYPAWIVRHATHDRVIMAELEGGPIEPSYQYLGPRWIQRVLGPDQCRVVHRLKLYTVPTKLARLRELRHLKHVTFTKCELLDDDLERLGALDHVESLSLDQVPITDRALGHLCQQPQLKSISLVGTQVSAAGLQALAAAPLLSSVRCEYTAEELAAAGVDAKQLGWEIKTFPDPPDLVLRRDESVTLPEVAREEIASLLASETHRHAMFRVWSEPYFNDGHFAVLPEFEQLRYLSVEILGAGGISPSGLAQVTKLPKLRSLNLSGNGVRGEHLAALQGCVHLEELRLAIDYEQLDAEGLSPLAALPKLVELKLGGRRLRDKHLPALRGCKMLKELSLENQSVTSDGLMIVKDLPQLETLNLGRTDVGNRLIPHLLAMPKLGDLSVLETCLDNQGQEQLAALPYVHRLWVGGEPHRISTNTVTKLRKALPRCNLWYF
jgi:Leucine-rich repeat (LRR) protein